MSTWTTRPGFRRLGHCDVGLELHVDLFYVVVHVRLSVVDRSVVPQASRRLQVPIDIHALV
ncbi:hypothetical protein WJ74_22565 [Burkholderia ubonensis]|nr:hypothetical protein WJ74_22565 [Burkholderia ubonensis]